MQSQVGLLAYERDEMIIINLLQATEGDVRISGNSLTTWQIPIASLAPLEKKELLLRGVRVLLTLCTLTIGAGAARTTVPGARHTAAGASATAFTHQTQEADAVGLARFCSASLI